MSEICFFLKNNFFTPSYKFNRIMSFSNHLLFTSQLWCATNCHSGPWIDFKVARVIFLRGDRISSVRAKSPKRTALHTGGQWALTVMPSSMWDIY